MYRVESDNAVPRLGLCQSSLLVIGLFSPLTALVGPWEVCDWDDEETVAAVCDTGKGVVPGCKRSEDTKGTTSLDACFVGTGGAVVEVDNSEQEEGKI